MGERKLLLLHIYDTEFTTTVFCFVSKTTKGGAWKYIKGNFSRRVLRPTENSKLDTMVWAYIVVSMLQLDTSY